MTDVLSTIAGTALLAVASVAAAGALRVRGRAAFAAAALVLAAAIVVLAAEVLSLPEALTRGGLLLCEVLAALAAVAAWALSGRARPPGGWRPRWAGAEAAAVAQPALVVLLGMAAATILIQLVVAVAVAPSNWDSMTYHLSRAAYWLQQESARQIPGGSLRQINSAPNGELLQAWTMAITGTDRFVALVQWLALLGTACCVYLGARLLDFARGPALFAAALFAVLPQPVLQSTSTQNDLIAAFFAVAAAAFGARGLRDRHAGDIAVAAVAFGLAVGTKGTVLALIPSLAILFGVVVWRARPGARVVAGTLAAAVVGAAALGAWGYVLNLHGQGSLFGSLSEATGRNAALPANLVRVAWTMVDAPGLSAGWVDAIATRLAHVTVGHLEIPNQFAFVVDSGISEDTSAFGLIGWLAVVPLLLYFAFARRAGAARTLAVAGIVAIVAFGIAFDWNIWVGRLLLPAIALAMPLCAGLARSGTLATLAVVGAALTLVPSVLLNPNKPLLVDAPAPNALRRDRVDQMTVVRPDMAPVIRTVDARLGARGALAFVGGEDSWDYPFFGEHRDRRVVRFSNLRDATPAAVARAHVRGVLFANVGRPSRAFRAKQIGADYWLARMG